MTTTEEPDEQVVRPFADFIQAIDRGRLAAELAEGLHDLVGAVNDHGRKGTLTLTITVEQPKKSGGVLRVTDSVVTKPPRAEREGSMFWTDKTGNLTRSDPNQPTLTGLREVPAAELQEPRSRRGTGTTGKTE